MSDLPSIPLNLGRRFFLQGAFLTIAGVVLGAQMSGCAQSSPRSVEAKPTSTGSQVLLAYFSRAGENYSYGGRTNLKVGNTEVLAGMISRSIRCDVYRITPVHPYPDSYDKTVERNVEEQNANVRPATRNPLSSINQYDIELGISMCTGG